MQNIKDISIKQFLQMKGINPIKDYNYYGMYHSPYTCLHFGIKKM